MSTDLVFLPSLPDSYVFYPFQLRHYEATSELTSFTISRPDFLWMSCSFLSGAGACELCRQLTRARCGTKVSEERQEGKVSEERFCTASVLTRTQRSCTLGLSPTFLSPLPRVSQVVPHPTLLSLQGPPTPVSSILACAICAASWLACFAKKQARHEEAQYVLPSQWAATL